MQLTRLARRLMLLTALRRCVAVSLSIARRYSQPFDLAKAKAEIAEVRAWCVAALRRLYPSLEG